MWNTATYWIDVAIFLLLVAIGQILLGHFESHRPKWRRVLKVIVGVALFVTLLSTHGRLWAWSVFVAPLFIAVVIIHAWWLPKHGIDGWTGEPREKYLALVQGPKNKPRS